MSWAWLSLIRFLRAVIFLGGGAVGELFLFLICVTSIRTDGTFAFINGINKEVAGKANVFPNRLQ